MNSHRLRMCFEITMYHGDGGETEVKTITAEERQALDVGSFDHVVDTASGTFGFRTESGEWIQRFIKGSGVGKKSLDILRAVQLYPGVFMTIEEIAGLTGNENYLMNNTLAVRVSLIRRSHSENPRNPRFLVSRREGGYALMWPARLSWIWIDRICPTQRTATLGH